MALSPTGSPTSSPSGSPSCSPPSASFMDTTPVDRRLSESAIAILGSLKEFLSPGQSETPIAALMRNTALCAALKEIHKNMLSHLSGKGIGDRGLNLILEHCPSLESLNISGFHLITEVALPRIATLRNLTTLNLCGTAVKDLTTLCMSPLPQLTSVNFCGTPIPSDSLISFLQCHSIRILFPPANPSKGFFARFPSECLSEVTLHIDQIDEHTLNLDEVLTFLKEAPSLQKLTLTIDVTAYFNTVAVSEAPTPREFFIKFLTSEMRGKIKGKNTSRSL